MAKSRRARRKDTTATRGLPKAVSRNAGAETPPVGQPSLITDFPQPTDQHRAPPAFQFWPMVISGLTVLGLACAAAATSCFSENQAVGITAWVAVAVIGTSGLLAAAKASARVYGGAQK